MTQWKLVPVELTDDMADAMECQFSTEGQWAAALSAAPSLAGDEDEVDRVMEELGRGVCVTCDTPAIGPGGGVTMCDCGHSVWRPRTLKEQARAAIAAMRPAPKLTEEDRAMVEEVLSRHTDWEEIGFVHMGPNGAILAHKDRAFLLSLIDKLTEAG